MTDKRTAKEIDCRLGERVRARRLELNMSQQRLAELVGVTFQQIQKYEKGTNRMAVSRLFEICEALESDFVVMCEGIYRVAKKRHSKSIEAPGASELLQLYADIENPDVRDCVLDCARVMSAHAKRKAA